MLANVVLLGLFSLCLGSKFAKKEAPVHFDSSTIAFTSSNTLTGKVRFREVDGMLFEVTDTSITKLTFTLTMKSGDASLAVVIKVGNKDEVFVSGNVGDDQVVITSNDGRLTDGLGLTRVFVAVVVGVSRTAASYTLTATAEMVSDWRADSGTSLEAHVQQLQSQRVLTVSAYQGDATQYLRYTQESRHWPYALGVAVLVGAGNWVGKRRSAKSRRELGYSLIHTN